MEEFVLEFIDEGSITEIDMVSEITGLTLDEIRNSFTVITVDTDNF